MQHDVYRLTLDEKTEIESQLNIIDRWIWRFFKRRMVAPNTHTGFAWVSTVTFGVIASGGALVYGYTPFVIVGLGFFITGVVLAGLFAINNANLSFFMPWVFVFTGLYGYASEVNVNLTVFGVHLEPFVFMYLFATGLIAFFRRRWNAVIWEQLDIIYQHYLKRQGQP